MSTTVTYKGSTLATVSNTTKKLLTSGKYMEDDLTLTDVSGGGSTLGTKTITANGTYDASSDNLDGYSQVTVNVSGGGSGIWQDQDGYIHVSTQPGSSGISLVSSYLVVSTT